MNRNAETPRAESGASQETSAVVRTATVAQPTDRPEVGLSAETDETAAIRDYWHAAKARYKRGDFPDYGSPDWCALPLEDPRKMAGLVAFAQMWLRYGDEIAEDLTRQLHAPQELWQRATTEACDTAFRQILAQQQHRKEAA